MPTFIQTVNHGEGPINLSHIIPEPLECRPLELHYKSNGAKDNQPSFAMVMDSPLGIVKVYGQFSLKTLTDCLRELGYEVKKIQP